MKGLLSAAAICALSLVDLARGQVNPEKLTGNTTGHDPTMCRDDSGKYFVFSTGVGLPIRTSADRKNWTYAGQVFPDGANWTNPYTKSTNGKGVLWAPDCTYLKGTFYLYYSASTSGSQKSAIFLAKSTTGKPGSFVHQGLVTETSSSDDHNAIDPNLLINDGKWYLSFGSFWTGIKVQSLNPRTGKPSSPHLTSVAQRTTKNRAVEGSVIYKNKSFYYLFTSWDKCCDGTNSTYNIRVGRSKSPTGPYVDKAGVNLMKGGGTLVLGSHDNVVGPGGQDLMTDDDGPVIVYHYWNAQDTSKKPHQFIGINKVDFSSGWPLLKE